jgi:hypothetical protein
MKQEYSKGRDFDRDHMLKIADLKSFLSSTTYSIGRKAQTASGTPQSEYNKAA